MSLDKMTKDKMTKDKMTKDKMTCCRTLKEELMSKNKIESEQCERLSVKMKTLQRIENKFI